MKLQKPITFFDVESTGLDKAKDHIVQIALIKIMPDGTRKEKEALMKPPIPIPKEASEVHGIYDEDVKDAPTFKQLAKGILSFIEGSDLAGFNSNSFDIPLLNNEFKRAGITWNWKYFRFVDVGNMYKIFEPRTLAAAFQFYMGLPHEDAHNAMSDVSATVDVFGKQLEAYGLLEKSIEELALISNFDREIIDLNGVFRKDEAGDYVWNIGKNKDKKAKEDISYLQWAVKATFDEDVKAICSQLITQSFKTKNYK